MGVRGDIKEMKNTASHNSPNFTSVCPAQCRVDHTTFFIAAAARIVPQKCAQDIFRIFQEMKNI